MELKTSWKGSRPDRCTICGGDLLAVFYDARIPVYGMWGLLCHTCFDHLGCSLGTGRGQKYDRVTLQRLDG